MGVGGGGGGEGGGGGRRGGWGVGGPAGDSWFGEWLVEKIRVLVGLWGSHREYPPV